MMQVAQAPTNSGPGDALQQSADASATVAVKTEPGDRPASSTDVALQAAYAGGDPATLPPARRWYLANQSVEANPGVPGGFVVRAVAFLAMGRPWEAVADLDRALRFAIRDATTTRCDRRSADDEEARIRLLRGHAHTACLSYDRAAADFTTAAEILDALEEATDQEDSAQQERATSAHARAGLGVCYCHMRRWSDAIRTGEAAIAELAYDDIARTHASRAVETARQHLAMERRGGINTGHSFIGGPNHVHHHQLHQQPPPMLTCADNVNAVSNHHAEPRHGVLVASHRGEHHKHGERPSKRVVLAKQPAPAVPLSRHQHKLAPPSDMGRVAPEQLPPLQPPVVAPPMPSDELQPAQSVPEGDKQQHLSIRGRDNSAMSMSSLPKNLSIASIAMSLSMASICSDNWELGGETSPPPHGDVKRPSAASRDDEDDNVGLHLDDAWQPAASL